VSAGESTVFVVDDDPAVRDSLALLARAHGLSVATFEDAVSFFDAFDPDMPGCVIADLDMPGMDGLALQEHLIALGAELPLLILTGHGDVPAAVRALKHGAVDFVQKPYDPSELIATLRDAIERDLATREARAESAQAGALAATLTPREHQVMLLVARGCASKVVAIDLGISERTVEVHRARVMRKMGVRSLAELVRLVETLPTDC